MPPAERLARLIERIDAANREDPNTELVEGRPVPRELVYSQRLTDWVLRLDPQASEPLRIAARGQHIRRWTIPRSRYPMTRQGYLRWRETLKTFHVETVAGLMREAGYAQDAIEEVRFIMGKRRLKDDAQTQALEDALCLVFLETQLADLRKKTPEDKLASALRKSWDKMSAQARAEAMKLNLPPDEKAWIVKTLAAGSAEGGR